MALLLVRLHKGLPRRHIHALRRGPTHTAQAPALAIHLAGQAHARHRSDLGGLGKNHFLLRRCLHHGPRQGVLAGGLQRRGDRQGLSLGLCLGLTGGLNWFLALAEGVVVVEVLLLSPFVTTFSTLWRHHQRLQGGLALGQGAGFVKHHHVDVLRRLQGVRVADQNAALRGHAGARDDGHGRGQTQGTGAGNHQHRHRMDQGHIGCGTPPPPSQTRHHRNGQHGGHKHRRHLVHQALYGRFVRLRLFHHADDVGQHRVRARRRHPHHQTAIAVDAATCHPVLWPLAHRQRLAREQRLVGLRMPLEHHPIGGDALARQHRQMVAHQHIGQVNVLLAIWPQPMRVQRAQGLQGANRLGGAALDPRLHPLAQQHQGDDHRCAFKIHMRLVARRGRPPQAHRQGPARRGAQGHQQIHVAAARLDGIPSRPVKARTQHKLHRGGQGKLPGHGQHRVLAPQARHHRPHQGQAQGRCGQHRPQLAPMLRGGVLRGAGIHPHAVARIADGAAQARRRVLGHGTGAEFNVSALGGQVHADLRHARLTGQGPLHPARAAGTGHAVDAPIEHTQVWGRGSWGLIHGFVILAVALAP